MKKFFPVDYLTKNSQYGLGKRRKTLKRRVFKGGN